MNFCCKLHTTMLMFRTFLNLYYLISIISFGNSDRVAHKKRSNSSGENVPKDLLAMFSIIFILTKNQIA